MEGRRNSRKGYFFALSVVVDVLLLGFSAGFAVVDDVLGFSDGLLLDAVELLFELVAGFACGV